jgi:hypothetical protein
MMQVHEQVNEMMLGWKPDIDVSAVRDDLTCRTAGWSFLQNPENKLADIWKTLLRRVETSSFRGKPFIKSRSWQPETCSAFLTAGLELNKAVFAASHLTASLPGRGTEITSIRYLNTKEALRNVFFYGGQMIIIISYNKARASNNYAFYIVRYLQPSLSLSFLKYLAIIRPVWEFLAKQLHVPRHSSGEFFFLDPHGKGKHLSSGQASIILKDLTQDLATPWTLSLYRQAALAIAKRYLRKLVEQTNFYHPSNATDPIRIFAAGAGHHPRMLLTTYAIDRALPERLQPELLDMYYRLSTIWQEWNEQYYTENCSNLKVESHETQKSIAHKSRGSKRPVDDGDSDRASKRVMTGVNNSQHHHDENDYPDGFLYNVQYQVLICVTCGSIVQPGAKSFYAHLNNIHRITGAACKALIDRFGSYNLRPFNELTVPHEKVPQITGLPVHRGFRCNECPDQSGSLYFTINPNKIRQHMPIHNMGITPIRALELGRFQQCYLQTFSSAKGRIQYFEVEPVKEYICYT